MNKSEFWAVTTRALAIFNRKAPPRDTIREWFLSVNTLDLAIYSKAVERMIDGEKEFPRNFPRVVREYAAGMIERQRQEQTRKKEASEARQYNEDRPEGEPTPREWCEKIQGLIGGIGREVPKT